MPLRKPLFWLHLIAGTIAGIIILIMSVTGVLLTYQRQILAWYDHAQVTPGASRLPLPELLKRVAESQKSTPTNLTVKSDPAAAAEVSFGREKIVYADPYTGAVIGEPAAGPRRFFRTMTDWHRWLGQAGEGRATGRAITGACNLAFLFLVVSGLYLWMPRRWSAQHFRPIVWFRGGLAGRARDFNWHNVIGIWSLVPLFWIVLSGVAMSYPWANDLLYTLTGSKPPAPTGRPAEGERGSRGSAPSVEAWTNLDAVFTRVGEQSPGWKSVSVRLPNGPSAPVAVAVDRGNGARPDLKSQVVLNGKTGETVKVETFGDYPLGRKIRLMFRFVHTGEAGGLIGQTIAGLASLGGAFLVYTGIALSLRRLHAWRTRKQQVREAVLTEV